MRDSKFWSESKIYFAIVWTMIVFGCIVLLSGLEQPLLLLVISSSIAGVMMFIYSILLIQLNREALPEQIKIRGVRLGVMAFSVAVLRRVLGAARHRPGEGAVLKALGIRIVLALFIWMALIVFALAVGLL